jgi:S1-C subfamily serine protease
LTELWDDPPPARRVGPGEAERLAEAARALGPAVMYVGHPQGDSGTGFVISRRHRLVATNAHVAAIFHESDGMVAVAPGSGSVYRVARVWYHPNYFEALAAGSILGHVPRGGRDRVVSHDIAPDVAVLQLAPGGPDLPAEAPLAGPDELRRLTSAAVGKLGFPGGRPARGPGRGRSHDRAGPPAAVFARGAVSRDRPFAPRWDVARRWHLVDASTPMRKGESGGPVFLANGHVVAVSTWGRSSTEATGGGARRPIGTAAVRIDALRELLAAYKLDDRVTSFAGAE